MIINCELWVHYANYLSDSHVPNIKFLGRRMLASCSIITSWETCLLVTRKILIYLTINYNRIIRGYFYSLIIFSMIEFTFVILKVQIFRLTLRNFIYIHMFLHYYFKEQFKMHFFEQKCIKYVLISLHIKVLVVRLHINHAWVIVTFTL